MTTATESQAPAVEVAPVLAPEVVSKKAAKPAKEKKAKIPKEKKPKQSKIASHPPYFQMIKEAVLALNEKSGSSPYAIAKYMEEKHKSVLPANFKKMLGLQLKNSISKGKLIKIKASYKLSEAGKKEKKVVTKVSKVKTGKKITKQGRTKSVTAPKAKATKKPKAEKVKKVTKKAKKSTPVKPKQPKSIKSPAAKRAKKTTA
ncbi:hypothetical protein F8388_009269 [Cannabis sativa]|uniref:H15 domain-containing protein n=1 Tax=Cannabis sativa TaxID=3483 RepID=A0A7J6GKA3_CANSA|nr:hypothetical protein G4B88_016912 [Cannabis sativa]KAF4383238.1 hypothetical protein F8388_009269 [Cannabis sativa]